MRRDFVYLAQTDTTVGFLSRSAVKLAEAKGRPVERPFLKALPLLAAVGEEVGRVPALYKNLVRRGEKRSFILPNGNAFRVVTGPHRHFIARCGWCYTTSANPHGQAYDPYYARERADVIVEASEGFHAAPPSTIIRLGKRRHKKVR
jgi:tRNA A37 threonylcarbamoyladenosine synthetase subunit TsaC/SUA5/YrdC